MAAQILATGDRKLTKGTRLDHGNVFKVLVHEIRIGQISKNNSVGPSTIVESAY